VLGAVRAGADPAGVAARLPGLAAARCQAALEALAAGAAGEREEALQALGEALRAPVPAGMGRVHPGWIRRVLDGESTPVIRAAAEQLPPGAREVAAQILAGRDQDQGLSGPGLRPEATAALLRMLFAGLAPMPEGPGDGVPAAAWALCAQPAPLLLETVERLGAVTLGRSLAGAPSAVVARAAAGIGEPFARAVVEAAAAEVTPCARAAARALVAAASAAEVAAQGAARAIGLRALAADLGGEDEATRAAVAQRLPPASGEALLAALGALDAGAAGGSA
jgi:hypothetical protein